MEEENNAIIIDSENEEENERRLVRKRGRPPTRRIRIERERLREESEKNDLMNKGRTLTGRKGRIRSDLEEGKVRELRENPSIDLSAEVLEQAVKEQ